MSDAHEFTGDERDSESNLDHTQFRQYSSSLGRWMHPDPAGLAAVDPSNPQSWNRYAYVLDDPLDLVDPLGLGPNGEGPPVQTCWVNGTLYTGAACNLIYQNTCNLLATGPFGTPLCINRGILGDSARDPKDRDNRSRGGKIIGSNGNPCTPSVFNPSCKPPSCLAVFFNAAGEADPLNLPAVPPGFGPDDAAKAAATALATKHIIERGLVVPLRSSIVRNILSAGEFVASAVVLVPAIYQLSVGLNAEYDARKARTCTTAFGN